VRAVNEAEVFEALRNRYPSPEWALLAQVANRTGAYRTRYADAVAVGLWPSRGFVLHGFEIKATRGDWIREMRNPAKAEDFVSVCDAWWIAAGEKGLVKPDELPLGWGLLEPHGGGMRATVTAKPKDAHPDVPRSQWVSIIRRAWEAMPSTAALKAEYERGQRDGTAAEKQRVGWETKQHESLRRAVDDFEKASGISINTWGEAARQGRQFKAFQGLQLAGLSVRLRVLAERASALAEAVREAEAEAAPTDMTA
jgi:hypothetical protein